MGNFILEDVEGIELSLDTAVIKIEPPLENLEVTPTKEQQTFNHENSYGYDNVTINPIPDEYIIPDGTLPITENTTYDVREFAKVTASVHPAPNLQDKDITIKENGTHFVSADDEYDGLNQVSVTVSGISDFKPRYISFYYFNEVDLNNETSTLNTSNMTDMSNMFYYCRQLRSLDLSKFDTSNVKKMGSMFYNCLSLETIDFTGWDTSNVTYMYSMFYGCNALRSPDLSGFNMSKVTDIGSMFSGCKYYLTTLDLNGWDTSSVIDMRSTFNGCEKLATLNVKDWDTSNCEDMMHLFRDCSSLTSLDLSGWNTSKNKYTNYMFSGCKYLKFLDIRNFDFSSVTTYTDMFKNVPTNCEIIVKDDAAKTWITSKFTTLTNVKTVAEYEA